MVKIQTTKVFREFNTLNKRIGVWQGGTRCFIGITLINTINGYIPIKDINIGDLVYSYDKTNKQIVVNKVIDKFIYKVEQPLLNIKLKNGETIICTPQHRFLFQGQWITAFGLAKRRMEKCSKHEQEIFYKQFRKIKNYELQKNWQTKNNESCFNKKRQEQEKNEVARSYFRYKDKNFKEINLNNIYSINIFLSDEKVYDLEIENTHSYIITKDNFIVHNSGKTYNLVLGWIIKLLNENNKILTICRVTMPSLKNTVYRDFLDIMDKLGIYDPNNMSKVEMVYKLGTNLIEFRNLDDDMKVRGAKRDYLYINEANEVSYPIWKQLIFRTKEKIVLDYNPSDEYHWIYDKVIPRDDCDFFRSTYLDNPFLPLEQVKEIERLKKLDPNYWRIYGLGERGMSAATIYKNWELTDEPKPKGYNCYGLDFGFNDPNALVDMVLVDAEEPYIWVDELLYQNQLTTPELINIMKEKKIGPYDTIFGDNSRPETIQEIKNAGFNIHPCSKGEGSIKAGIDWIRRYRLKITKRSLNIQKEIKSYKWKVNKDEIVLEKPVDANNHAMDSLRYSLSEKINAIDYGCSF